MWAAARLSWLSVERPDGMNDILLLVSSMHIIKMHVRWRLLSTLLHEFRRDEFPFIFPMRARQTPPDSSQSAQSGSAIAAPPCGRVANNFTTDLHPDCFDHRVAVANACPRARVRRSSQQQLQTVAWSSAAAAAVAVASARHRQFFAQI